MSGYITPGRWGPGTIKTYSVIGFAWDGDHLCTDCAEAAAAPILPKATTMSPLFADTEFQTQPACGVCLEPLPYATVIGDHE